VNRSLTRIAMAVWGTMLAHQIAAKAFRDATFLSAWPASALPLMTVATAVLTAVLARVVARFSDRYAAAVVVACGLGLSAAGHIVEWVLYGAGRWNAVVIYLHLAGVTALLLSGFWSLTAERFDPEGARRAYGRIGAAGTAGGLAGSIAAERMAVLLAPRSVLLLLAALHLLCVGGVLIMKRIPAMLPAAAPDGSGPRLGEIFRTPYVRSIATFVILTSASSAIVDFLLKANARASFGSGPDLLRFFALFYGGVQLLSFLALTQSAAVLRRFRVTGAINVLPGVVVAGGALALVAPGWLALTALRGVDAIVRSSLFRGAYELLFVPMDARTRNRVKAVLDVICDRVGEAAGSGIVQVVLLAGLAATTSLLLTAAIALAVIAFHVGQRFGPLYLDLIERELVKHRGTSRVSLISEAGWTELQVPTTRAVRSAAAAEAMAVRPPPPVLDAQVQMLADLRSRDAARVTAALSRGSVPDRLQSAQAIELLAWDEVLPAARAALERAASAQQGMLVDALLDPATDFVIRRRLPRLLGEAASERSLRGLVDGLDDMRFEVRYHCGRAIARLLQNNPQLSIDRSRMIEVIERELSVPPQKWRGYRLLDRPDSEHELDGTREFPSDTSRFLEYVFLLLSTIVPRDPLDAAVRGFRSPSAGVRGLATEYFDQVLPPAVLARLREFVTHT
jgi:ATP:ADP antiporter, AAA family